MWWGGISLSYFSHGSMSLTSSLRDVEAVKQCEWSTLICTCLCVYVCLRVMCALPIDTGFERLWAEQVIMMICSVRCVCMYHVYLCGYRSLCMRILMTRVTLKHCVRVCICVYMYSSMNSAAKLTQACKLNKPQTDSSNWTNHRLMTVIRLHLDEKHDVTASKILDNSRILHDSYSTTDRRAEPSTQGCHPGRSRLPRGQNSEHLPAYDEDASMSNSRMMHVQDFCFHWRALSLYHWHTHKHTYTYTYTDKFRHCYRRKSPLTQHAKLGSK